jgi:hypothetical protein
MWTAAFALLAFLVVFPAFWSGVVWLVGQVGWRRLARDYETDAPITGRTFRMASASIGWATYSNTLTISIEPGGLRLAPMLLFRPGHPPVLIPWDDIEGIRPQTLLWHTSYALDVAASQPLTVRVPERVVRAIRDELAEAPVS